MPSLTRLLVVSSSQAWLVGCGAHVRAGRRAAASPRRSRSPPFSGTARRSERRARARCRSPAIIAQAEAELRRRASASSSAGHLVAAREHFDRAVDVLLSVPGGARSDPRLRGEFDRLVDRISALEVHRAPRGRRLHRGAVRAGGHRRAAERRHVRARPRRRRRPRRRSRRTSQRTPHDMPIPLNEQVLVVRRAVPGPAARLHAGRPRPRRSATCR